MKGYEIIIGNVGGIAAPVVIDEDGTLDTLHQTPLIWKDNFKRAVVKTGINNKITEVYLEGGIVMDADSNG